MRSTVRALIAGVVAVLTVLNGNVAFGEVADWSVPDIDSYFYKHFSFGGQASYAEYQRASKWRRP